MDGVDVGVISIDAETGIIETVNPAVSELIGAPASSITGQRCFESICRKSRGECRVLTCCEENDHCESEVWRADGSKVPAL